jgi:hypothetical protein
MLREFLQVSTREVLKVDIFIAAMEAILDSEDAVSLEADN